MVNENQLIYAKNTIEFVTVAAETCRLLEQCGSTAKPDFVSQAVQVLPLLYFRAAILDTTDGEAEAYMERFVTEDDYLFVKQRLEQLLGADDHFLEVFHPDMPYSDTPVASSIAENLADVYQELKDFIANFQLGEAEPMTAALYACMAAFAEHWGQKLLNALRALHAVRHSMDLEEED